MFCYACEFILGKINPSKIFRSHSADLCDAIEAIDHSRLAFRLFSQFLINDEFRNKITELDTTPYKKAEMIVNELQRQLESAENNSDPVECLDKICEVLVKMKDDTMIHIADDIRRQLEMHENTEESKDTITILICYTLHAQDRMAIQLYIIMLNILHIVREVALYESIYLTIYQ